jgi:hypothetical protein
MPIYFAWFTTALLSVGGDANDQNLPQSGRLLYCVIRGVAVEKLAQREFSEITSCQEALQTISPSLLDIFYHPIFDFLKKNRLFQHPQDFSTPICGR